MKWTGLLALTLLLPALSVARDKLPLDPSGGVLDVPQDGSNTISTAVPQFCAANHNVGRLVLSVTNYGVFAAQQDALFDPSDCFTGNLILACEYPKRSGTQYSYAGAFWIGAIVGRDTLVSVGADGWQRTNEFFPDQAPFGNTVRRSILEDEDPAFPAVSEQDYISVYTDTYTSGVAGLANDFFGRPHLPIHIEVTQRSYSWSYPYADDFVLFDYSIKNIGINRVNRVFMGVYVDADVQPSGSQDGFRDDICGFQQAFPAIVGEAECEFLDTVNIAWIADNDGDLEGGSGGGGGVGTTQPVPAVTATRIVRTPSDSLEVSFNWWVSNGNAPLDFGPQTILAYRDFQTGGFGTPEGDVNKYHQLSNNEFDYDQVYTLSIQPNDSVWLFPNPAIARDISDGFDTRYLLSFGPFNIEPGSVLPISFAYVAGERFHTDSRNLSDNITRTYNPGLFVSGLGFDSLAINARWASWVYDNPGVDTDGDKYAGKYWMCGADGSTGPDFPPGMIVDTIWYEGDGVPDFRGASPPPAPEFWATPSFGKIKLRWNGWESESTRDVFSRELDFEGYRVYYSRDDREPSYTMLVSYDIQDYNIYSFDTSDFEWDLVGTPQTLENLQNRFGGGDENWDPELYTRTNPYVQAGTPPDIPDSVFAFERQDFNRSEFGATTAITKRYSDWQNLNPLDYGVIHPDSVPDNLVDLLLTEDGYFKYFEYEYTIENLLPSVPYYVNITAFDYGSPESGLASLETSKTVKAQFVYALDSYDEAKARGEEILVWPNPYLNDANYIGQGFEGRFSPFATPIEERERRVHFANLPAKCTIRIYTLDGDLVREIAHDYEENDPLSRHDEWDLITRNTQAAVSGIYYWTVETPDGNVEIGKLVLIM
jgi:hypothetical protein